MNISTFSAIFSLSVGVFGAVSGIILWYRGAVEKQYASQRDFNHLRRNQEQIASGVGQNSEELEVLARDTAQILDEVKEMSRSLNDLTTTFKEHKSFVLAISNRMEGLAARIEGEASRGWSRNSFQPPS